MINRNIYFSLLSLLCLFCSCEEQDPEVLEKVFFSADSTVTDNGLPPSGEVTYEVVVPDNTPSDEAIYISGNFPAVEWAEPGTDDRFRMEEVGENTWSITLKVQEDTAQYFKFFREGGWNTSMANPDDCASSENLALSDWLDEASGTVTYDVLSWQDICLMYIPEGSWTGVITSDPLGLEGLTTEGINIEAEVDANGNRTGTYRIDAAAAEYFVPAGGAPEGTRYEGTFINDNYAITVQPFSAGEFGECKTNAQAGFPPGVFVPGTDTSSAMIVYSWYNESNGFGVTIEFTVEN